MSGEIKFASGHTRCINDALMPGVNSVVTSQDHLGQMLMLGLMMLFVSTVSENTPEK